MNMPNLLKATALAASLLALSACNQRDDMTVGQTVDKTVSKAKSGLEQAKQATESAAGSVATAAADATITAKVNAALVADDQLKALKIDVDTQAGRVVLKGTAPDNTSLERASALAKAVDGVVAVDNRLTVAAKG